MPQNRPPNHRVTLAGNGPPPPPPPRRPSDSRGASAVPPASRVPPPRGTSTTQPVASPAFATQNADSRLSGPAIGQSSAGGLPAGAGQPNWLGRYQIIRALGSGGFGTVYLARDTRLNREVALKLTRSDILPTPGDRAKFLEEARKAAAVSHTNICTIYDCDEHDGQCFISMEYIEGDTLHQLIAKARRAQQPLEPGWVVAVVREIALAVGAAHAAGLVHRDLKPGNILLSGPERKPVITDFGLARYTDQRALMSASGTVGTPAYMSPEQIAGKRGTVTQASDVYSLGVCLYELITGRVPFDAPVPQVFLQHTQEKPVSPRRLRRDCDPRLERICLKTLAKKPGQRYASMLEFAAALESWQAVHSVPAPSPPDGLPEPTQPMPRPTGAEPRGSRWATALWLLTFIVGVGIAGWFGIQQLRQHQGKVQGKAAEPAVETQRDQPGASASSANPVAVKQPSPVKPPNPVKPRVSDSYQLDLSKVPRGQRLPDGWTGSDDTAVLPQTSLRNGPGPTGIQATVPAKISHENILLTGDFFVEWTLYSEMQKNMSSLVLLAGPNQNRQDVSIGVLYGTTAYWYVTLPRSARPHQIERDGRRELTLRLERVGNSFLVSVNGDKKPLKVSAADPLQDYRGVQINFGDPGFIVTGLKMGPLQVQPAQAAAGQVNGNSPVAVAQPAVVNPAAVPANPPPANPPAANPPAANPPPGNSVVARVVGLLPKPAPVAPVVPDPVAPKPAVPAPVLQPARPQPTPAKPMNVPVNRPQRVQTTAHRMNLEVAANQLQPVGWSGANEVAVLESDGLKYVAVQGQHKQPLGIRNDNIILSDDFFIEWELKTDTAVGSFELELNGHGGDPAFRLGLNYQQYRQDVWTVSLPTTGLKTFGKSMGAPVTFRLERNKQVFRLLFNGAEEVARFGTGAFRNFEGVRLGFSNANTVLTGFRTGPLTSFDQPPAANGYTWQFDANNPTPPAEWRFAANPKGNEQKNVRFELPPVHLQGDFRVETRLTHKWGGRVVLTLLGSGPNRDFPIFLMGRGQFSGYNWDVAMGSVEGTASDLATPEILVRLERNGEVLSVSMNGKIAARYAMKPGEHLEAFRGLRIDNRGTDVGFLSFNLKSGR